MERAGKARPAGGDGALACLGEASDPLEIAMAFKTGSPRAKDCFEIGLVSRGGEANLEARPISSEP
jgi:hypothetical protein